MAANAKDLQLKELKDSISELNKLIRSLQETLAATTAREEQLRQERDNLKEQVDYLTKKLFGKSSEKGIGDIPGQLNLFDEAEALQAEAVAAEAEKMAAEQLLENLPRYERAVKITRSVSKVCRSKKSTWSHPRKGCMDHVSEVLQRIAIVPPGTGSEASR